MPTTPADESPETLSSLMADLKRAERKLEKARTTLLAAGLARDTIRERIHELTKPSGQ